MDTLTSDEDKDGNSFVTSYKRNCRIWIGSCGIDSIRWSNAIVTTVKTVKESEVLQ